MSELGYYEPNPGIHGTPNPATDPDPVSRAALQEATTRAMIERAGEPGYVPPNYAGPASVGPSNQQTGGGSLPIVGWTAQNSTGPAFHPYDGSHIGRTPDWTNDANPAAAGSYDMNQVFTGGFPPNRLGVAPVGDGLLQYDDTPTNPNAPTTDVSGSGDLEY